MAKDKKAGTNGYYNPADFLNQTPSWANAAPDIKYKDPGVNVPVGNDAPSWYTAAPDISSGKNAPKVTGSAPASTPVSAPVSTPANTNTSSELPPEYLAQRRPSSDPTGKIAADMEGTEAPQDTPPTGKQVDNTNAAVANAQPGDWVIRSNGSKIVLTQADIDWAKSKLAPAPAPAKPKPEVPVTSTATPDVKDEAQMTMMTGGRFTGDEKAREAYAPRSKALQPEAPKQVNNAAKDIAKAKVGDWIIRSNGTKVMLSQADIDWAKGVVRTAGYKAYADTFKQVPKAAKAVADSFKQGYKDTKAAHEAAGNTAR